MNRMLLVAFAFLLTGAHACHGQVVQLPTVRQFSVSTSVLVPDRGSVHLGGVRRSSMGSVSRGVPGLSQTPGAGRLFGNRAIGRSDSAAGMSVRATIIDLREWDEAVLAEAAARRHEPGREEIETSQKAANIARHIGRRSGSGSPSRSSSFHP